MTDRTIIGRLGLHPFIPAEGVNAEFTAAIPQQTAFHKRLRELIFNF
jgi:hypothetical protein